jgi:hypothetical protein
MLCGINVINDLLITKITDRKELRSGVDYKFCDLEKTKIQIPKWTKKLGPGVYNYEIITPNSKYPYIGRYFDTKHTIVDVVFSLPLQNIKFNDSNPPFTIGWDYNLKHSSVGNVTTGMVSQIKDLQKRRNPLYVATFLAANLDSNNSDFGIMEGNWNITDFKPDQCPSCWKDSGMICRKYLMQGRNPVKYAQCWVFAELLTGMLRFLGIIARTVKIHNCHIDIHNVSGVDFFDDSVKMKGDNSVDISKYLNSDEEMKYIMSDKLDVLTTKEKGYIYSTAHQCESDITCLNYLTKEGRNWNFHVWTEVYVENKWWVLDPSPIKDYKYYESSKYEEFKGKKFFGPTEVKAIRNNNGFDNSFKYLQAAVNGPLRYWSVVFSPGKDIPVFYLKNVIYNTSQVVGKDKYNHIINRTLDYRRSSVDIPDDYYCLYRYNPVYLYFDDVSESFKDLKLKYRSSLIGDQTFLVQTCLFLDNILLMCHRYKTDDLKTVVKNNLAIDDDDRANKLTIVIYSLTSKKWWCQMIRL